MVYDLIECSNPPMLTSRLYIVMLLIAPAFLAGQLPVTNIYHFKMTKAAGKYSIKSPKFLTQFNKDGYNNQPAFFGDDLVYFTSNYYDEDQTEIASMDLFEKKLERITYTSESEYSPIPVSENEFSCVRVEKDKKTQSLRIYPNDGMGFSKRYMNNSSNIGYHAWLDSKTIALFLVEEPDHLLAIADAISERRKIILDKIGRTLKTNREGHLFFIHKLEADEWYIKEYDDKTNRLKTICKTLDGIEDFELLNDGSIIAGKEHNLYLFDSRSDDGWQLIFDLSKYGIRDISRICSHKSHLLIVDKSSS